MSFRIKNKNVSNRSFFGGFSTEFTLFQFLSAYADQLELLYNSYTILVLLGLILIMPYLFFGGNKAEGSSVAVINTPQISGCIPPEKDPKKDKKPEGEKETSMPYYLKVTGLVVNFGIYYYGLAIAAVFSSFTEGAKPQQRTHEEELNAEMDALRKQNAAEQEAKMDALRKQNVREPPR